MRAIEEKIKIGLRSQVRAQAVRIRALKKGKVLSIGLREETMIKERLKMLIEDRERLKIRLLGQVTRFKKDQREDLKESKGPNPLGLVQAKREILSQNSPVIKIKAKKSPEEFHQVKNPRIGHLKTQATSILPLEEVKTQQRNIQKNHHPNLLRTLQRNILRIPPREAPRAHPTRILKILQ